MNKVVYAVGYASDMAGAKRGSGQGPAFLQHCASFQTLKAKGLDVQWLGMIEPSSASSTLAIVQDMNMRLARQVDNLVKNKQFFWVVGGDHSSAIGTWSGAYSALHQQGEIGLIWIDAHMDSHTHETSETGNIHGMPLASLLGHGDLPLVNLFLPSPKLRPENICLIGVRSYEAGEEALLKKLNVRIFFMDEIEKKGMDVVMTEAIEIVTRHTIGFGVSVDVDAVDPSDAPGTGVAEPNGISGKSLCQALKKVSKNPQLIGVEIVEFDPSRDRDDKTEKLVADLLSAMVLGQN